jgi:3-oxoacyl-[acyl-carrier-protein] synthase-3
VIQAQIAKIAYYLPKEVLGNQELARLYSGWTVESIERKLGVRTRHIAAKDETASDMAVKAAQRLFERGVSPGDIDFVLLCTQEPDYFLPTSACLIQDRLGIPKSSGAFDFNLGCSGFVYGLAVARGLIETDQARNVLLLTSNTYSKYINPLDRITRPLFGDAAAATLISGVETDGSRGPLIGPFVFGTDGSGADLLIVRAGGHRLPCSPETAIEERDSKGGVRSKNQIYMHGPGIFTFALRTVPKLVNDLLEKAKLRREDIDLFVFHQANKFMLQALREQCELDEDRYVIDMVDRGNTVSSTIPIALLDTQQRGGLKAHARVMFVGFGVGLSWAGTIAILPESI